MQNPKANFRIGGAIGLGLIFAAHALPKPYGPMLDDLLGWLAAIAIVGFGAFYLWVRFRSSRRASEKPPLQSD
jgi:hypothetical protein